MQIKQKLPLIVVIVSATLWTLWLASVILGPGPKDLAGQIIGADFLQFYAAGYTLKKLSDKRLYDRVFQKKLQEQLAGSKFSGHYNFNTPPHFALLFVPFTIFPYLVSFAIWALLGLACLYTALRLLGVSQPLWAFIWSACWYPVFAAVSFGQTSLVSLLLLSLTYWLWKREMLWAAGFSLSFLLFKPQLVLGVVVLWLCRSRKDLKALLGFGFGGCFFSGLCFLAFPRASNAYIKLVLTKLPPSPLAEGFAIWKLHSIKALFILLFSAEGTAIVIASTVLALGALVLFWRYFRNHVNNPAILFSAAVVLTYWLAPYVMVYDICLLLVSALLFWENFLPKRQALINVYSLFWLVSLLNGPLIDFQLTYLPFALHLSVLTFIGASYYFFFRQEEFCASAS